MANIPKVWNGTAFIELEAAATVAPAASTTVVGIVQLTDSTSSTSTTTAATPNSVKSAFDLAGTAIPKNTVTAAGDILYASGSATVARLGIGTADQVLGIAAGVPAWTTPSSGAVTFISSTTVGTATQTVTLSSIPQTYKVLRVVVSDLYSSTTTAQRMDVYINNIQTSTYGHQYVRGNSTTASAQRGTNIAYALNIGTDLLPISNATVPAFMTLEFYNYTSTTKAKYGSAMIIVGGLTTNSLTSTGLVGFMEAGTAAITSLVFYSTSATNLIAAGSKFDVYGVS